MEVNPAPDPSLPWAPRVLLRVEIGSTAHGTNLPGTDDYDEIGVMVMPRQHHIGLPVRPDRFETISYRPGRREGERSQADDYDLVVHSARKFANLAAAGNPSVLMVLFGPLRFSKPLGDELRSDRMVEAFWSERARARFLGYSKAQRERLVGERGGAHTNRPELVEKYGFDTKYAMHMLRLGFQGIEYMNTGRVTLPIPDREREFLLAVRRGEVSMETAVQTALDNEKILAALESKAPPEPDLGRINNWLWDVDEWWNGEPWN